MYLKTVLNFILLINFKFGFAVFVSSDIHSLLLSEQKIASELASYLGEIEEKVTNIKRYLNAYQEAMQFVDSYNETEVRLEDIRGNPLHVFHLLKRLYQLKTDVLPIMENVGSFNWSKALADIEETGMEGPARGLLRIHEQYNLNSTELIDGRLFEEPKAPALTAKDCYLLGKIAFGGGNMNGTIEWLNIAFELSEREIDDSVDTGEVYSYMMAVEDAYNQHLENVEKEEEESKDTEKQAKKKADEQEEKEAMEAYGKLCRGEDANSSKESALRCFFSHRNSSYLILMPVKTEMLHEDPPLMAFYDVVTDRQIELLIDMAKSNMSTAKVLKNGAGFYSIPDVRAAKIMWVSEEEELRAPELRHLNAKISAISGLSTDPESTEELQIGAYGVGGHYRIHHDAFVSNPSYQKNEKIIDDEDIGIEMGDRIATFMFYLSDVKHGGKTAFPRLGVSVAPRKGAAVFWYNLKKSGAMDEKMIHGACPVMIGSKWVANKWIRERNQFDRRLCGLKENE